jgi:cob(I)alamin adenosyltransferase
MVKLTKIYTRTGDEGMTGLSDFSRTRKTDPRIEAYADVDEANSAIGLALSLAKGEFDAEALQLLSQIQNDLFDLGADLSNPHLARTIVRRAERATWHAIEAYGTEPAKKGHPNGGVSITAAKYLNRLSDLLFVLARYANIKHGGDVLWVPAANRSRNLPSS